MTTYLFLLQHYTQIMKRFTHWCCTLIFYIIFRFSKSDYRWADNRFKNFKHKTIKKGEIYQFKFGKNYVLPIFSYNPDKHIDIYHPIDFPLSKSHLFLLKNSEFSFITHDSVLKLNDLRTVSVNRILYQQKGFLSPSSST